MLPCQLCFWLVGRWGLECFSDQFEFVLLDRIAQKAIMSDSPKSAGEDMHAEPAEELHWFEADHFSFAIPVVLICEVYAGVIEIEESLIANGDSMGIFTQILNDLRWTGKRSFGIDDPFFLIQVTAQNFPVVGLDEYLTSLDELLESSHKLIAEK